MSDQSVLQQRISARLNELRRNPRDVSVSAGLGPDAIRTIMSGRSRSPRGQTLAALAKELECDVSYLLGSQEMPLSAEMRHQQPDGDEAIGRTLLLTRLLSASWFGPTEGYVSETGHFRTDVSSLPDYHSASQELMQVDDHHADQVVPAGGYLHVHALGGRGETFTLRDRDLIVVMRLGKGTGTKMAEQLSCRRVRLVRDGTLLELPSLTMKDDVLVTTPELVVGRNRTADAPQEGRLAQARLREYGQGEREAVFVLGLVLRAITVLTGPSPARDHIEFGPPENA